MELKVLFIAVFFVGACAGFSLPEGREADEGKMRDLSDLFAR